jgi:hypothetical protein
LPGVTAPGASAISRCSRSHRMSASDSPDSSSDDSGRIPPWAAMFCRINLSSASNTDFWVSRSCRCQLDTNASSSSFFGLRPSASRNAASTVCRTRAGSLYS